MKQVMKLVSVFVLVAASTCAFAADVFRQVTFDPTKDSPALRMVLQQEWGNYALQFGQTVRLMNGSMGVYRDWTAQNLDGNANTVEWVAGAQGTYVQTSVGGGGAAGPIFWVSIIWDSTFETTCSIGGTRISCDDETEFP